MFWVFYAHELGFLVEGHSYFLNVNVFQMFAGDHVESEPFRQGRSYQALIIREVVELAEDVGE